MSSFVRGKRALSRQIIFLINETLGILQDSPYDDEHNIGVIIRTFDEKIKYYFSQSDSGRDNHHMIPFALPNVSDHARIVRGELDVRG